MNNSSLIPAHAKAVIFDAYGTLFDVHSAVGRHMAQVGPDAARFSEVWRTKQLEYSWVLSLAGRYEPFWTLTERALDYAFARFPDVDRSIRPLLLEAYRTPRRLSGCSADSPRFARARPSDRHPVERRSRDAQGGSGFGEPCR